MPPKKKDQPVRYGVKVGEDEPGVVPRDAKAQADAKAADKKDD